MAGRQKPEIKCCRECGRDTRRASGVCGKCIGQTALHDLTPEEWAERGKDNDEESVRDAEIAEQVLESLDLD